MLNPDTQRLLGGPLGRLKLPGSPMNHSNLMPGASDRSRFAQDLEAIAGFGVDGQRLVVAFRMAGRALARLPGSRLIFTPRGSSSPNQRTRALGSTPGSKRGITR